MRKGATLFLALALLVMLAAGGADAWVRARMYDGGTPTCPHWPEPQTGLTFLGKPGWVVETCRTFEEVQSGELNGPALDKRFSLRVLCTEQNQANKVKIRSVD